jgi:hypothetical protein
MTGLGSALILLLVFTFPFVASAIWAASRGRSNRTPQPLTSALQEKRNDIENHTRDINRFRFSESRA